MAPWKGIGSVVGGTVVTIGSIVVTVALLPVLGLATAEVVGNGLSVWLFGVPLVLCPVVGGATAGFLQEADVARGAIGGGLAGALGVAVIGVFFGFVLTVIALGFTPGHAGRVPFWDVALPYTAIGGGTGFVAGAVFGAVGGVAGQVGRAELGP